MAERTKRSLIWMLSAQAFAATVARNSSIYRIQLDLGFAGTSGSIAEMIKQRIKEDQLDTSHFFRRRGVVPASTPLEEVLVEHSSYISRAGIKKKVLAAGLVVNKCAICGTPPQWKGKPLTLQLDHINGVPNDHRVQNLRLLCPNCHSQTPNFSGKNASHLAQGTDVNPDYRRVCPTCRNEFKPDRHAQTYCSERCYPSRVKKNSSAYRRDYHKRVHAVVIDKTCIVCGNKYKGRTKNSLSCSHKCAEQHRRKADRPDAATLRKLVWSTPVDVLAKQFGVSGVAIKKWCVSMGIETPGRGYWTQVKAGKIKRKAVK